MTKPKQSWGLFQVSADCGRPIHFISGETSLFNKAGLSKIDAMDGAILIEIERSLEAFLSLRAHCESIEALSKLSDSPLPLHIDQHGSSSSDTHSPANSTIELSDILRKIELMCTIAASRSLDRIVRRLLAWIDAVERRHVSAGEASDSRSTISALGMRVASWLAARMITIALQTQVRLEENGTTESLATSLFDRCFKVFELEVQSDVKRPSERGGFLSSFIPSVPIWKSTLSSSETVDNQKIDTSVQHLAVIQWKLVFGQAARISTRIVCSRLQRELGRSDLVSSKNLLKCNTQYNLPNDEIATQEHVYFQFLSELPLDIADQKSLKKAAQLFRVFFQLLGKNSKSRVRRGAAVLIASILARQRRSMSHDQFRQFYGITSASEWNTCISELHAIAMKLSNKRKTTAVGWSLRVSVLALAPGDIFSRYWKDDMHALLRLQHRYSKDSGGISIGNAATNSSGASMAIGFYELSPGIILQCVGVAFCNFVLRHSLVESTAGTPSETDCMEMINVAQAWCFFSANRYKSFVWYQETVLPVLIDMSVAIAGFNMRFALQNHVRRLLTESDTFIDDKKLVGLEVLRMLCRLCVVGGKSDPAKVVSHQNVCDTTTRRLRDHLDTMDTIQPKPFLFSLDEQMFAAQLKSLGEITGHILIHCNTYLGNDLLFDTYSSVAITSPPVKITSNGSSVSNSILKLLREDSKRALASEIYASSLSLLEFVFDAVELRSDQKIILLARGAVHKNRNIRRRAIPALLAIAANGRVAQAGAIVRCLTDYLVQMSFNNSHTNDVEPLRILMFTCGAVLEAAVEASFPPTDYKPSQISWENLIAVRESFLQVDSATVLLLSHGNGSVRLAALDILEATQRLRKTVSIADPKALDIMCPMEIIAALESDFVERYFSFQRQEVLSLIANASVDTNIPHIKYLAGICDEPRHEFRWSLCLENIYPKVASEIPEIMVYFWSEASDKISKLEPVVASSLDTHPENPDTWRNLSIFALASACPNLVLAKVLPSTNVEHPSTCVTAQSAISSTAVTSMIKRLGRYIKSPSLDQQRTAILALGATHPTSHVLLIEVLTKCESDAFTDIGSDQTAPSNSTSRTESFETLLRPTMQQQQTKGSVGASHSARRLSKAKTSRATSQWQNRWAILRVYRILLDRINLNTEYPQSPNEDLLLSAAASFLVRMGSALDDVIMSSAIHQRDGRGQSNEVAAYLHFMIQQDFCTSIQLLLQNLIQREKSPQQAQADTSRDNNSNNSEADEPHSRSPDLYAPDIGHESFIKDGRIPTWAKILLTWSQSFGTLADPELSDHLIGAFIAPSSPFFGCWMESCDIVSIRDPESGLRVPWLWLDELALWHSKSSNQTEARRYGGMATMLIRFIRFFVVHNILSTLITLVDSNQLHFLTNDLSSSNSQICRWLDECFAIDCSHSAKHFSSLQVVGQIAATRYLDFNGSDAFFAISVEKACFRRSYGACFAVAKQNIIALSSQASSIGFKLETQRAPVIVQLLYALLLHLGVTAEPTNAGESDYYRKTVFDFVRNILHSTQLHDVKTYHWLEHFSVSVPRYSTALSSEVQNRIQVAAASAIASAFPALRLDICVTIFRSITSCDISIQRNMLGAVLPFLVDIPRGTSDGEDEGARLEGESVITLLGLMYELTLKLIDKSTDQLDRVWLTFAYSSSSVSIDASLRTITNFLMKKRESKTEIETSKMILWWLARWEDAAFNVVSILCDQITAGRLRACSPGEPEAAEKSAAQPLATISTTGSVTDTAVLVSLISDLSCHLQPSSSTQFKAVVLQTMHFGLLLMYMLKLTSNTTPSNAPNIYPLDHSPSREPHITESESHCALLPAFSNDNILVRECCALLRTMTQFLSNDSTSGKFIDSITCLVENDGSPSFRCESAPSSSENECETTFEFALKTLTQALAPDELNMWRDLCVKEIILVLSMASNSLAVVGQKFESGQDATVRFAIRMYSLLGHSFVGDVLLALLELLHIALDERMLNPDLIEPLICDCLVVLSQMVERMPDDKMVLYPQVFWVAIALLNHFPPSKPKQATLSLLGALLAKPSFVTNEVLHDVILSNRPGQWSLDQSSVLYALLSMVYCDSWSERELGLKMIARCALLFPPALLVTTEEERIVLCSAVFVPAILGGLSVASHELLLEAASDLSAQWRGCADLAATTSKDADASEHTTASAEDDREALSRLAKCFHSAVQQLQDTGTKNNTGVEARNADTRRLLSQFVVAFLPAATALQRKLAPTLNVIGLTFRVLAPVFTTTKAVDYQDIRLAHLDSCTMIFVEELLLGIEAAGTKWLPPSTLVSSVAKFVSSHPESPAWPSAVRILSLLSLPSKPATE